MNASNVSKGRGFRQPSGASRAMKAAPVLLGIAALVLSGCGSSDSPEVDGPTAGSDGVTTIVIGASSTPHAEILEYINTNLAAKENLKLDVKIYDDYVQPNEALKAKELDANYFQHLPYLEAQKDEQGYEFTPFEGIHYEPYAVFSKSLTSLDDLPQDAKIGLTNDPSNQARALNLLADAKVITLKDTGGADPTLLDVAESPKNVTLIETAPEQLSRSLEDLDAAVINGNFAIQADLSPTKDGIYLEKAEGNVYSNIVAVRTSSKDNAALKSLDTLLHSPEVKAFIEKTWPDGSVLPAF